MQKIIALSGDIGSGKSSVAKALRVLLPYDIVGTGVIQRSIAKRRGLTTLELNQISKTDRSVDDEIDSYVIELGKKSESLIIDSRLAWHFIPHAFKVFLAVDQVIGAERVFNAARSDEHNPSLKATLSNNLQRQTFEDERFRKLYQVNFQDYKNYNVVIDSSYSTPEQIAEKIKSCFEHWQQQSPYPHLWLNAKRLRPTQAIVGTTDAGYLQLLQVMQQQGFDDSLQLEVAFCNNKIYLLHGHKKTLAANQSGLSLLPAHIVNETISHLEPDCEQQFSDYAKLQADWESCLGFHYPCYP